MTRSEIALLLGAAAARDLRTIGEADVLAWHEDLGDLDFADARTAVSRHYRQSTDRLMPAHVRQIVRIIRDERRASQNLKQLPPGRFESDPDRDNRIARNVGNVRQLLTELAARRSIPPETPSGPLDQSDEIRQRALAKSRESRTTRRSA